MYELKTLPKLVRYYHTAAGFPTKPSWLKAIKNKQYPSWPGLTWEATNKHFPESKETSEGHGCKTRSGLQSTKTSATRDMTMMKPMKQLTLLALAASKRK